ncbi:hypothetical protein N1851_015333 [Merluccius polli]|uniref:Uncharacterized protein n=1 Tax=Merluccius polli TaxID=89951 RepID=A0AA47MT38_MERPO|nr:hypothetical protein N1851_015333 [Merluccius polli]
MDGSAFDTYKPATWSLIRTEYPTRVDHKSLKGHTIGDTENPASYLQKQVVRWCMETEKHPEEDPLVSVIFRTSIIETLPSSIRNKLEDVVVKNKKTDDVISDSYFVLYVCNLGQQNNNLSGGQFFNNNVVGLTSSKSHKEFSDHLVHAVDRYRQNKLRMQEQSREVQRKLFQLQLEELTRKDNTDIYTQNSGNPNERDRVSTGGTGEHKNRTVDIINSRDSLASAEGL